MKKVAMVVQRYGDDIIGGAESLAKQLSEKITEHRPWNIDIYTTTAKNYQTWEHSFPSGQEQKGSIQIKRFVPKFRRNRIIFGVYNSIFSSVLKYFGSRNLIWPLDYLRMKIEHVWFILQGPYCPELVSNLVNCADEYECIYFYTYLYYPSVQGQQRINSKAILVPFAHDENPLYFNSIVENFNNARQILVNCEAEKDLILRTFRINARKISQAGIGLADAFLQPSMSRTHDKNIESKKPYILFMGRVCKAKGIDKLLKYFDQYKKSSHDRNLSLVIAGQIDSTFDLGNYSDVTFLGRVTETQKLNLLNACLAVVNPSDFESLSILVLEAICCRKPVLVNGNNPVLYSYTKNTQTVMSFVDSESFGDALEKTKYRLSINNGFEKDLDSSADWVFENYSWNRVIESYEKSMRAIVEIV